MKDKILISLIAILFIALFVETAYLLQLKYDKHEQESSLSFKGYQPRELFKHKFDNYFFNEENAFSDFFKDMEETNERINMIFGEGFLLRNLPLNYKGRMLYPETGLEENEDEYIVKIILPGMEKEKINVELKGNLLIVSGEHNENTSNENHNGFYSSSHSFGSFRKVIPLPENIKADKVHTEYKHGLLIVTLPKTSNKEIGTIPKSKINI